MQANFILDSFWLLFWKCVKQWEKNIWPFDWTSRDFILPTMVIPLDHQDTAHNWKYGILATSAQTIIKTRLNNLAAWSLTGLRSKVERLSEAMET